MHGREHGIDVDAVRLVDDDDVLERELLECSIRQISYDVTQTSKS